jgi:hypothetical protein
MFHISIDGTISGADYILRTLLNLASVFCPYQLPHLHSKLLPDEEDEDFSIKRQRKFRTEDYFPASHMRMKIGRFSALVDEESRT